MNLSSPRKQRDRKSFFALKCNVALAFLKMYMGLSVPKLMDALKERVSYLMFFGIWISLDNRLKIINSLAIYSQSYPEN